MTRGDDVDRVGAEAVSTVYRTVAIGVLAAAAGALTMAATMVGFGYAGPVRGAIFAAYICICAGLHIALRSAYFRRPPSERAADWRRWGAAFAAVALLEGLGWGWSPVGLVAGHNFEAELICLIVTLGIVGGALAAFGPYLPAFLAIFLPSILPYAVHSAFSLEPIRLATSALALVYIFGIGSLGVLFNRSFLGQVSLRFRAEGLADALKLQVAIAEAANRAKSTFLAAASHDLRQPVHALSLFVGALRGMAIPAEAVQILEHIETSTQALDGLFAALLDISKLDAGIVEVERRNFLIAPMLERICRESEDMVVEKGLGLKVRAPRRPLVVRSDPVLIERILRNLVANAIRYTQSGRVLVACRRARGRVSVEVWDTGPGIPAHEHDAIFQEYYQLGNTERDRTKGLGLGLAIVRRLTRLLDCNLTLRSRIGRGSVFAITIAEAEHVDLPEDRPVEPVIDNRLSRFIVVIDDEADIRVGMSTVLERWGHEVVAAASGADALAALADRPTTPDLIIADFRLRQSESGIDAVEALRSEYNLRIPAILVTGDTAPERLVEARASGLLLLHKPLSNSRLRAAIANTMLAEHA